MDYRVKMILKHIDKIKPYPLPKGYKLRFYQPNEANLWATAETLANEFDSEENALKRFNKEFEGHEKELEERLLFLETDAGEVIGTIMAWYGQLRYENEGRIHWVSIIPKYQGKGLGKPLLYEALKILQKNHKHIYLTTQSSSLSAINLYKKFGFVAYKDKDTHPLAWPTINKEIEEYNTLK